jgi:hypothetical protein
MTPQDATNAAPPVRVHVAGGPATVAEVVHRALKEHPRITLAHPAPAADWPQLLSDMDARIEVVVLIATSGRPAHGICSHLLDQYPALKVLVVDAEGGGVTAFWLGVRRQSLGLAPAHLGEAVLRVHAINPTELPRKHREG